MSSGSYSPGVPHQTAVFLRQHRGQLAKVSHDNELHGVSAVLHYFINRSNDCVKRVHSTHGNFIHDNHIRARSTFVVLTRIDKPRMLPPLLMQISAGNPNNLFTVTPPALIAAIPVGAHTTTRFPDASTTGNKYILPTHDVEQRSFLSPGKFDFVSHCFSPCSR